MEVNNPRLALLTMCADPFLRWFQLSAGSAKTSYFIMLAFSAAIFLAILGMITI
jgi:hypothetical protein